MNSLRTLGILNSIKYKGYLVSFIFALLVVAGFAWFFRGTSIATNTSLENLPTMKTAELAKFNGTDSSKPIYVGFEGLVYNVTPGREYYQAGGSYHFLAGKDSTADLNIAGGEIIKRKYQVVAKLAP